MNRYLLPGAALMGLISANARGATCTIDPGSTPCTFNETASTANPAPAGSTGLGTFNPIGSPTGVGGIGGPISFNVSHAGTLVMTVQPTVQMFAGDVYQAFVNGNSLGFTTPVPLFGSNFSTGTFTTPVAAGTNNFDINDQLLSYIGLQAPYGPPDTTVPPGFTPNSVTITLAEELPSAVPEPGSLALLGSWLLGLGVLWRRRTTR